MSALKAFRAIVKREFFSYFVSPLAYVVLTAFLLIQGYTFYLIVLALNQPETPRTALMSLFFTSVFYWIFMMLISSVIAMRLLSEERKTGSIEALLTAPVSEATVVAGKFAAGWCFFLFLWLPTVLYPVLLSRFGTLDWGPIAAGYLGIALVGALFISAGTFASALTKNQIVAAIVGFVFILGVFLVGVFRDFVTDPGLRDAVSYLNLLEHMDDFARGIVDTRRILYVASTVVFFLFLSTRALEANKGR
ncbi:MAG TPA: ABC transporter permease [Thermoanaerobaculia bacterium]|nr:ABC transporter permease [Thermoanaerobaculia bacterium]